MGSGSRFVCARHVWRGGRVGRGGAPFAYGLGFWGLGRLNSKPGFSQSSWASGADRLYNGATRVLAELYTASCGSRMKGFTIYKR